MIHFISDTHFRHTNIIRLAGRPFDSVEEMDATLIENWNADVKQHDTVYHLGDFGWGKVEVLMAIWRALNGKKVLVSGNHDRSAFLTALHESGETTQDYLEVPGICERRLCLFHYPMLEWNGAYGAAVALHGHTHSPEPFTPNHFGRGRLINVAVEATEYRPVSLSKIMQMISSNK